MARRWSVAASPLGWLTARPIAHRGLHDEARGIIENSPSAFAAAIRHGYAIECDLQLSDDGEAVVFHDDRLDRLTGETGAVAAWPARELLKLRLKGGKDRITKLADLLAQVRGRTPLLVEMKSHWDGDTRLARRAVEVAAGYGGPLCLMSFDPDLVAAVRDLAPGLPRGIVADRVADRSWSHLPLARRLALRHLSHLPRTRPHFLSFDVDGLPSPASRLFREAGLPIVCWTVRDEETRQRALRWSDQVTFEGFLP
jgi:glycerophosphoryl diester phosphodiesterase